MTKRKKHVFDTGEIPHLWAHRTQEEARNRQGNLYFTGDTIYSYGSHFPIARHVANDSGERAVLLTTATYSVTTSGHWSAVRSSIPSGIQVFHVPNVCRGRYSGSDLTSHDHEFNLGDYAERVEKHVITSARARSSYAKQWNHEHAVQLRDEALAYCAFFGMPVPNIPEVPELDSEALTSIRKREAKRAAEKAEQTKRERAEAIVRQQELILKWRAGQYAGSFYDIPVMLRIVGDEVQTSRGARFPISHAKRALAFVRKVREAGQAYVRNGRTIHLGPYALDRIEPDGTVKSGCHVVSWQEIEQIAPFLDSIRTSPTQPSSRQFKNGSRRRHKTQHSSPRALHKVRIPPIQEEDVCKKSFQSGVCIRMMTTCVCFSRKPLRSRQRTLGIRRQPITFEVPSNTASR
jgi:hypothetical protein